MTHFLQHYGLWFLFAIIGLESAGAWLPGETALIAAEVAASQGKYGFGIVQVIVVAAGAAIVGDNVGYWLGREGGRRLLHRWKPLGRLADRVLPPAERFFERHGGKTVFFGRFFAGLRVTAAWVAGISRMPWWRFLLWNAAGGIVWATGVALVAYYFGKAAGNAIERFGLFGILGVVAAVAIGLGLLHFWRRRMLREEGA